MKTTSECWEQFLNPDVVRPSLFLATMFITTFEILKDSVVDRIRSFYEDGWNENGPIISPSYQSKVISRNKNILYASLEWLQEHEAIDSKDLGKFEELKKNQKFVGASAFRGINRAS
jgi:hypothetical protein